MKSISEELVKILKERMPKKDNTAGYIMDILPLGREAVYRRLRGEVAFTLDEAVTICKEMNISLDLMIGINQESTYAFHLDTFLSDRSIEDYCKMLNRIKESLEVLGDDPSILQYRAHRTMPQEFLYNYKFLSKVYVYILYYQLFSDSEQRVKKFSEIEFSEEVVMAQQASIDSVHNYTSIHILDKRIFSDYIEIIKYFHFLGMLNDSDISMIKEELHKMINDMESCAANGLSFNGKEMTMYICQIPFDCGYTCLESENFYVASVGVYCIDYLSCQNRKIHSSQKIWIKSLIRFSTLISASGELHRNEFFQTQRNYVNSL